MVGREHFDRTNDALVEYVEFRGWHPELPMLATPYRMCTSNEAKQLRGIRKRVT